MNTCLSARSPIEVPSHVYAADEFQAEAYLAWEGTARAWD
jgi:hypothetical protein